MVLAVVATVVQVADANRGVSIAVLIVAVAVGAAIGLWRAKVVEMTGMPELIALLHSFVGIAAVLIGWNGHLEDHAFESWGLYRIHMAEVGIGIFIGGVTFTGSIVAFLKLSARIRSSPLMLPGKNYINIGALGLFVVLTVFGRRDRRRPRARPGVAGCRSGRGEFSA